MTSSNRLKSVVSENKNKMQDTITGNWHYCQVWNCKSKKAYGIFAGCVHCKKHYERELIKTYGSLEKAKKYIGGNGIPPTDESVGILPKIL